jgi:hypothetical protein
MLGSRFSAYMELVPPLQKAFVWPQWLSMADSLNGQPPSVLPILPLQSDNIAFLWDMEDNGHPLRSGLLRAQAAY